MNEYPSEKSHTCGHEKFNQSSGSIDLIEFATPAV